jgi:hypothetical protein
MLLTLSLSFSFFLFLSSYIHTIKGVDSSDVPFKDPLWWASFRLVGAGYGSHNFKTRQQELEEELEGYIPQIGVEDDDDDDGGGDVGDSLSKIEEDSSSEEEGGELNVEEMKAEATSDEFTAFMKTVSLNYSLSLSI